MNATRLLLLDDDTDFADAHAEFLESRGFDVNVAYSLQAAERTITNYNPQVALLDLRVGNHSGIELIEKLKQTSPDTICILMTGFGDLDSAVEAVRHGAADYLRKPIEPEELVRIINRNLERQKLLQDQEDMEIMMRQEAAIKTALQEEIERRRKVEKELLRHQEELEQLVEERTSELRSSQERLNQASKMQALGTLAGGIAHDFNNLLTAITGFTFLAKEHSHHDDQLKDYLKSISAASGRATELVKQILTFSRRSPSRNEVVDVEAICIETLGLLEQTIPANINIETTFNADHRLIEADPTQVQQVLLNLASNAASAIDGPGNLRISLENREILNADQELNLVAGEYLVLTVADDGQGIPEELQQRIFDPFYTTRDVGEGTGMGLAVVHSIVTSQRGAIKIDSKPGFGSEFAIFLPVTKKRSDTLSLIPDSKVNGKGRVLIVEDEEMLRTLYLNILTTAGFEVTSCCNGVEALRVYAANQNAFSIVVTDESMPGMNGMELCAQIRALDASQPLLLCSGRDNVDNGKRDELKVDYLAKPFLPRKLVETIVKATAAQKDN